MYERPSKTSFSLRPSPSGCSQGELGSSCNAVNAADSESPLPATLLLLRPRGQAARGSPGTERSRYFTRP